jgi:hypothetical protein
MRIHESFSVARSPKAVFAFMVAPENLAKWQTIKTPVTPLTEGRLGIRSWKSWSSSLDASSPCV